jgi:hypothetical protein
LAAQGIYLLGDGVYIHHFVGVHQIALQIGHRLRFVPQFSMG